MKKPILMCLLATLCVMPTFGGVSLVVILTSSEEVTFALSENPSITFSGGNMIVNESPSYTYSIADVSKYTFKESTPTDVNDANVTSSGVTFSRLGDVFTIEGLPSGVEAYAYGAFGGVVDRTKSDADGVATLNLSAAGAGVYVLSAGGSSIKVTKR